MVRCCAMILALLLVMGYCAAYEPNDPTHWDLLLRTWGVYGNDVHIGARADYLDGYDGQLAWNPDNTGPILLLHREEGSIWRGPTGFYGTDYESPIPSGGSKTWWDLCLWTTSAAYLTIPGRANFASLADGPRPPKGYWGQLVLDYVPDGLGWTGPWSFAWDLNQGFSYILPVPVASDGLQGTRMHLTVYTSPIPEPSSLLALAGGLMGLGAVGLLRRRVMSRE
jgi:hypothetical protein